MLSPPNSGRIVEPGFDPPSWCAFSPSEFAPQLSDWEVAADDRHFSTMKRRLTPGRVEVYNGLSSREHGLTWPLATRPMDTLLHSQYAGFENVSLDRQTIALGLVIVRGDR